jgi:hypothetical protein
VSQRSKNLLEAFNQSKAPEKSPEPAPQPRGTTPRAGGPFADTTPAVREKARPAHADTRPAAAATAPTARERRRIIVLCAGIAVIFFFVGRASVSTGAPGSTVQAAGDAGAAAPGTPPPAQAPARSIQEALRDPANQATILACTYTLEQRALAKAASEHLASLGFPAAAWENPKKTQVYLLVGAAPTTADLDGLLVKVKAANSARGTPEFATAWTVSIDKYMQR